MPASPSLMHTLIRSEVFSVADSLGQSFRSAEPFPHVVINQFFADDFVKRLIRDFPPFEKGCAVNESGELGKKATFEDVRELGETFHEADDLVRSREFLSLMSEISGIPDLLYDSAYIGGGTHENRAGQDLDAHVDFNYHPARG